MRRRGRRKRLLLLTLAALFGIAAGIAFQTTGALRRIELESSDLRFSIRGDQRPPKDVAVVGVDDKTFGDLNQQWPFKRGLHAEAIRRLARDGAKVIAYDVQFTEPSSFPRQDAQLLDAVSTYPHRLVFATTEVGKNGSTKVFGDGQAVLDIGAGIGNGIMPADANNVRRRVQYETQGLKSFSVAAVEQGTHRKVPRGPFGDEGAWIDFHGPGGTIPFVSFSDVVRGNFKPGTFRDRYVVVGATAPSLQDVAPTSTSGSGLESGPEVQAEAISTILRDFPLRDAPSWLPIALIVLLALIPGVVSMRTTPARTFLAVNAVVVLVAVAAQLAFNAGMVVPVVVPLAALALATVATLAVAAVLEAFERQRVRDAFAHFVPEAVVDVVLDQTQGELRLGGTSRECTVLFSDLRGFTTFSESRAPDRVIDILNAYLTEMSDAILDNGGTLCSFIGDGIMAVFGAPLDQPDHRDRALLTARTMLERLETFNERVRAEGWGDGFRMGIGINTGLVMVGNVGSARRLEYTAIGDAVNTASRIEGMTKGTQYQVFVADSTRSGLREQPDDLVFVDELPVRGRTSLIKLWGLSTDQAAGGTTVVPLRSSSVASVAKATPPS